MSGPSPLRPLLDERAERAGVRVLLKRDDLLHPPVSGTKWRKLRPNLERARALGHDTLLTFGGAWSNHLRAAAAAGREAGLRTVGVVRGDELRDRELNPVLRQAAADGMELDFVSRAAWRTRMEPASLEALLMRHGPAWVVPEGGSNAEGVRGCVALGEELAGSGADVVCCSVGTGGMLAGLAAGVAGAVGGAGGASTVDTAGAAGAAGTRVVGFAALGHADLEAETLALQRQAFGGRRGDWRIDASHVFGGYGRRTPELDAFRIDFEERHGLALDPSYEAKTLFALFAGLGGPEFGPGTTVVVVVAG